MAVGYLLDTNAISESVKPRPNDGFMAWFNACSDEQLFISCLTLGELEKGIRLVPVTQRQHQLEGYMAGFLEAFKGRILDVDYDSAVTWGGMSASRQLQGKTCPVIDGLLAAQAQARGLVLVTRNIKDFAASADDGLQLLSPWS